MLQTLNHLYVNRLPSEILRLSLVVPGSAVEFFIFIRVVSASLNQ